MTPLHALVLGIVQGVTEFLPISSDGHLALAQMFLGITLPPKEQLQFDVLLHGGTLIALISLYFPVWVRMARSFFTPDPAHRKLFNLLIVATIPGVIAGLLMEDLIATYFRSQVFVALFFLVTAVFLLLADYIRGKSSNSKTVELRDAVVIGIAQAFAILPGLSRSGMTMSAGQMLGLSRKDALDFSFLMATPIIFGAVSLMTYQVFTGDGQFPPLSVTVTGLFSSFGTSLGAMLFLRSFVRNHSLSWFAMYLIPVSILLVLLQIT